MSFSAKLDDLVAANSNGLLARHSSWTRVRLGDVGTILNGAPFDSERFAKDRGVPLIRIRDVTTSTTDTRYDGDFDPAYWVEPNDLIVGMDGDFKCALWRGPRALLNQRVCKITPDERFFLRRFLVLVLPGYLNTINDHTSSITVKHLSSRTIGEIPLPLPPLPEQRRIVEALETHFTRLDAAVATLERVRANLKRYRAAVLQAAVEGRLVKRASSWTPTRLGELLREDLRNGVSAKRDTASGGVRVLTITAVTVGDFSEANTKVTSLDPADVDDLTLEPGDIFVQRSNTPELVGTARLYSGPRRNWIFPDLLIRVRLKPEVSPEYIEAVLQAPRTRALVRASAQGIAGSMPKISQPTVLAIPVPLPTQEEQGRIVAALRRATSLIDASERAVEAAQRRCSRLRQSLLRTAFEGRLVPQDPKDEPASALLDRIRAERAATSSSPKKKSPRSAR